MENKELSKLVFHTSNDIWNLGSEYSHNTLDAILEPALILADKQGYMRALKEVEDALPKEQEMIDGYADELIHGVASWNSCLSQSHDAISKLKENI